MQTLCPMDTFGYIKTYNTTIAQMHTEKIEENKDYELHRMKRFWSKVMISPV